MKRYTVELPSMYGDHHVLAVRRLAEALPGVAEIYASSSFHTLEVTYDEAAVSPAEIDDVLARAGYLGELALPAEKGEAVTANGDRPYFRHSVAFAETGHVVGFSQEVQPQGRPLWPCPGVGVLVNQVEDVNRVEDVNQVEDTEGAEAGSQIAGGRKEVADNA